MHKNYLLFLKAILISNGQAHFLANTILCNFHASISKAFYYEPLFYLSHSLSISIISDENIY